MTQPQAAATKPPTKKGRVNLTAAPVAEAEAAAVVPPVIELDDPMDPDMDAGLEVAVDPAAGVTVTVAFVARETSLAHVTFDGIELPSMTTRSEH
jgi:hypothetical protein